MELYTIVGVNKQGQYFTPYEGGNPVQPSVSHAFIKENAIQFKIRHPSNEYFIMKVIGKVEPYQPVTPTYVVKPVD